MAHQVPIAVLVSGSGTNLQSIIDAIEAGTLREVNFNGLRTLWFAQHLYRPLLYLDSNIVEISPAPLNLAVPAYEFESDTLVKIG